MQILDCLDDLPDKLRCDALRKTTLALQPRVDLPLWSEFKDQVERIIVLVMIEQLHYILVIQFIHDLDFKFDLLDKVVLYDLCLVNDLDSVDVLTSLMSDFVNLSESTDTNVGIGERLKVILPALSLLAISHTGRQEKDSTLDWVDFAAELRRDFNRGWLSFHIFLH